MPHESQTKKSNALLQLSICCFLCCYTASCQVYRAVVRDTRDTYEELNISALSHSDKFRDETSQQLRAFDLYEDYYEDPDAVIRQLRQALERRYDEDLASALAEISYAHARNIEESNPQRSAAGYLLAVESIRTYLFRSLGTVNFSPLGRTPRFMTSLYNECVGRLVLLWQKSKYRWDEEVPLEAGGQKYLLWVKASRKNQVNPSFFEEILPAYVLKTEGLKNHYRTYGIGAPLIAVRSNKPGSKNYQPDLSAPYVVQSLTAVLRFAPTVSDDRRQRVALWLIDPSRGETIVLNGLELPLEADYSTSLALLLERMETSTFWELQSFLKALSSDQFADSIQLGGLEPFNPDKIPVVLVHGLFSDPKTYVELFNELRGNREIRQNFQFYFFSYPTGLPIYYTSYRLRKHLVQLQQRVDPRGTNRAFQSMVLIGHSMGGVLSRLMIQKNGNRLWDKVFSKPPEQLDLTVSERQIVAGALVYDALPFVKRVIFIATPHKGSDIAIDPIGRLGSWLISLPANIVNTSTSVTQKNEQALRLDSAKIRERPATSIDQLAPDNSLTQAMISLPLAADLPVHSIIGVQDFAEGPGSSDGVVTYHSSHVDEAQSEILVPAAHSCLDHPATIAEVKRILLLHLDAFKRKAYPRT